MQERKFLFNLWDRERWFQVERKSGDLVRVTLREALEYAQDFRAVYDNSPANTAGILRLLIAITQDILRPENEFDLRAALGEGAFPTEALNAFGAAYGHRFELFDEATPFYQCTTGDIPAELVGPKAIKEASPVARLVPDLATMTYSTFRSGRLDDQHFWCPACAAAALTALAPFTGIGGVGYRASLNQNPPVYIFPEGNSLYESLVYCLLTSGYHRDYWPRNEDLAWWRRSQEIPTQSKVAEVSYLHGLTFVPRRIRLYPEAIPGECTRCGTRTEVGIKYIHYDPGEYRPKELIDWGDPFAAHVIGGEGKTGYARTPRAELTTWRDLISLTFADASHNQVEPPILSQIRDFGLPWPRRLRYIGLETSQAKFVAWFDHSLATADVLAGEGETVHEMLEFAWSGIKMANQKLRQIQPGAAEDFQRRVWGRLYPGFRKLQTDQFTPEAQLRWLKFVIRKIQDEFYLSARLQLARRELSWQESQLARLLWGTRKKLVAKLGLPETEGQVVIVDLNESDAPDDSPGRKRRWVPSLFSGLDAANKRTLSKLFLKPAGELTKEAPELAAQMDTSDYLGWLTLSLAAKAKLEQADDVGLGTTLRKARVSAETFERILSAENLQQLVSFLAEALTGKGAQADLAVLSDDLAAWSASAQPVQRRWAQDYFNFNFAQSTQKQGEK